MGNLARKIIDGVQNSMLDELFVRLFPLIWLWSEWEDLSASDYGAGPLILVLGIVGLWLLYSLLEAAADQTPKPRQRAPYDPVHVVPSNSFPVSDRAARERPRPPAFIRSLVMTIGFGGRGWITIVEGLTMIGALALAWTLTNKSQAFWSAVDPRLAEQASREQLFLVASGVLIALFVRQWAVQQRERLSPSNARAPVIGLILLGVVFAAVIGLWVVDLLGFDPLAGLAGGIGLLALAVLPPWRQKVLDFLFGKREPVDDRP